jgi:MinD-like ATPase involved in chromosome partitioning or flagellar assembly
MKVAVVNLKGGSGKTLTSFFLATALAGRGRTLVVDGRCGGGRWRAAFRRGGLAHSGRSSQA